MNIHQEQLRPLPHDWADYHRRRADQERALAARSDDPAASQAHLRLADLHESQASGSLSHDAA